MFTRKIKWNRKSSNATVSSGFAPNINLYDLCPIPTKLVENLPFSLRTTKYYAETVCSSPGSRNIILDHRNAEFSSVISCTWMLYTIIFLQTQKRISLRIFFISTFCTVFFFFFIFLSPLSLPPANYFSTDKIVLPSKTLQAHSCGIPDLIGAMSLIVFTWGETEMKREKTRILMQ